jgi:SLT domain-containing protein
VTETALALTIPGDSEEEIETIAQAYLTREAGGPIQAGQPYLVGEAGPELTIPNASGKVISNDVLTNYFR